VQQLSAAQIVEQIVCARRYLKELGSEAEIENIVFMGALPTPPQYPHNATGVCRQDESVYRSRSACV
jgi:hypothetical protein